MRVRRLRTPTLLALAALSLLMPTVAFNLPEQDDSSQAQPTPPVDDDPGCDDGLDEQFNQWVKDMEAELGIKRPDGDAPMPMQVEQGEFR
jgi:hypothetical protein